MMKAFFRSRTFCVGAGFCTVLLGGWFWLNLASPESKAAPPWVLGGRFTRWGYEGREDLTGPNAIGGTWTSFPGGSGGPRGRSGCRKCGEHGGLESDVGGSWFWMRSPEQERVVVSGLFNRYCIRCHGIDGRGVWDIPGVPDFTNTRWQETRGDDQIARIIIEGRGAVMPAFRGTLSLEEAWAMARYLRTFVPGNEISRPDFGPEKKLPQNKDNAQPKKGL